MVDYQRYKIMMSPVILLGGSGFIGSAFARELAARNVDFTSVSRSECDYTKFDAINGLIKRGKPDLVINASGVTGVPNVDWCETHRKETIAGNIIAATAISDACYSNGAILGHISSGCIYDGGRPTDAPWTEEDPPNFNFDSGRCSFYSGTKAIAEWKIAANPLAYVWRFRLPFCEEADPKNVITKLVGYSAIYDTPKNSMSHLGECVRAAVDTWANGCRRGIYNIVSPGALTNREIVELIQAILKPNREYDRWVQEPEFYKDFALAPRSNCVLSCKKLLDTGVIMRPVRQAMMETLANYKP